MQRCCFPTSCWLIGVLAGGALLLGAAPKASDEGPSGDGVFISVPYPLTDKEVARITEATVLARQAYQNQLKTAGVAAPPAPLKIVYDFNPEGQASGPAPYGSCRALADFLLGLNDVTTVAFVHADVTRHAVLPVLACQEIVMAKGAKLGDALRDQQESPRQDQRVFYREVADKRNRSSAVVLRMLDKDLDIYEATRQGSVWYVDGQQAPEAGVLINKARGPVLAKGTIGLYSAFDAQKFGLCRRVLESREEVASWYGIPPHRLRDDPLLGRAPSPYLIEIRGSFTNVLKETVQRRIHRAIGQKCNFLILQLECGGGNPAVANSLAEFLRDLKDTTGQQPVMTVAYVTKHARDLAIIPALACTQIVMAQDAQVGDFEPYLKDRANERAALSQGLAELAARKHYPSLLLRGLVEPDLVLYRVKNRNNPLEWSVIRAEDLRAEQDKWLPAEEEPLKPKDQLLTLNAARARQLGLAQYVVDDLDQLYTHYRLEQVQQGAPDWLERLAAFLRHGFISSLLVMIGFVCAILELKLPGVTVPGVVAALCFLLFFWAHAQLEFLWLAVLLFLLGLVLLGLEIFVIPGFGFVGISGIVLIVGGLGLATLERWPQTQSEWSDIVGTLGLLGLCLVGAVVVAFSVARYLPNIPYANRLVLAPPGERGEGWEEDRHPAVPHQHAKLLGAIGVAATPLRPAGMVQFGEDYVDVVAESSYVEAGTRVRVVEIEAHRIVVQEV